MLKRIMNVIRKFKNQNRPFEIISHKNEVTLKSSIGDGFISVAQKDGKFFVNIGGDISFNINGDYNITINGETNIVSLKDTNIDTWKSTLNLNSRKSVQIRNEPEAIKYREDVSKKLIDFEKRLKEYNELKETQKKIEHECNCMNEENK